MKVKCPACGKETTYSRSNPHRPFCSLLCRNEDLASWAEEKFRVPVQELDAEFTTEEEDEDEDPGKKKDSFDS